MIPPTIPAAIWMMAFLPRCDMPRRNGDELATVVNEARRLGWSVASSIRLKLLAIDDGTFPGIRAFAKDLEKIQANPERLGIAGDPPTFDIDTFVTRNPNFWLATYEVAPGDQGWLTLHAGLLLSAGEIARAQEILALARLRADAPAPIVAVRKSMLGACARALLSGNERLQPGIALHDQGRYQEAIAIYDVILKDWPQFGLASYERGLTLMTIRMRRGETNPHSAEVLAAFGESRRHDPLNYRAYQGRSADALPKLKALAAIDPIWKKIAAKRLEPIDDKELSKFCEGCQTAEIDELALEARQVLVARRGRFDPVDHPFIAASLRRLAPGPETERILAKLAGSKVRLRQLIAPEKEEEAAEVAKPKTDREPR